MFIEIEYEIWEIIIFVNFKYVYENTLKVHENARFGTKNNSQQIFIRLLIYHSMNVKQQYFFEVLI